MPNSSVDSLDDNRYRTPHFIRVDSKVHARISMHARNHTQIDATGIRFLDLAALSCVMRVVEDAQLYGIAVVFAGCSKKLKASFKACNLYRRVGGPLIMHSTEEVYTLLVEAPSRFRQLASQKTSLHPPPHFHTM